MTHLPVGYVTVRKGVTRVLKTRPVFSAAVSASFLPAYRDHREYFACGVSADRSSAATTTGNASDSAVFGQIPSCPKCAVLWDQLLERHE